MNDELKERNVCGGNEHDAIHSTSEQIKSDCSVDDVFEYVGKFGRYQKLLSIYIWLVIAPLASSIVLSNLLVLLIVPHKCNYDASNMTFSNETDVDSHFLPKKADGTEFENCFMFDRSNVNTINSSSLNETVAIKCTNGWNYDYNLLLETIVSENDWVCDQQWKSLLAHSFFSIGMVLGSISVGILSDLIGRVSTTAIFFTIAGISGTLTTFSVHNYALFAACRIILGFSAPVLAVPTVLIAEVVGTEKRFIALLGFMLSFSTFNGLLPWIAYVIGDWRKFNLVVSLLYFVVPICSFYTIESPRWLLSAGKTKKAQRMLHKIAKINGKTIPKCATDNLMLNKRNSAGLLSIFKYKQLLLMFIISSLIAFLYMMVYVSHNLFVANLSKHPFALLSIFACFDIFSAFVSRFSADYWGRKRSMIISCLGSALLYTSTVFIPKEMTRLILVAGLLARIGVNAMMSINGVYSSEIFPTVVRSRLIAARMCFASLGTVISPLLVTYTFFGVNTPLFLFGVAIFVSGLLMILMPETLGKPLPDTFEDAENLMKSHTHVKHKNDAAAVEDEQVALSLISNSLKTNS